MKKNIEITGEIADVTGSYVGIRLHICSFEGITDFFAVDTKEKEILTRLNSTTKILLNIEHTYEDYVKLIADLGLEMPSEWKKHWTPSENETFYFVTQYSSVNMSFDDEELHKKAMLIKNYNVFPTRELAEKAVNLSKLERMILLWQYANDCLFEPDWLDGIQQKYYIIYDSRDENACYDYNFNQKSKNIYFEKREHVKAFIDMYEAEIKELMNIK